MVWHHSRPGSPYWKWVARAQHVVLTITPTPPLEPWIELRTEAVALFKYPTRCLIHKCPGRPHRGPLYMALHAPGTLLSELRPALCTHLWEHFGGHAALHPHNAPTKAPMYLQPRTDLGICFHDLPPLARIQGGYGRRYHPGGHDNGTHV